MSNSASSTNSGFAHFFEIVDCPFCGSPNFTQETGLICDGHHHGVEEPYRSLYFCHVRCGECGVIYQRERLVPEHLSRFYDDEEYFCYRSFAERGAIIRRLAMLSARGLIRKIESLRPVNCNRFLDFGCGNGSWLELFRSCEAPWRMVGAEISQGNIEHIRKLGFEGEVCDASNIDEHFEDASLSVIFMHHVIEHTPSPLELLRKLERLLVPGGLIVGQTPDADCLERRVFGDDWFQWHLPQHLVIFEQATLRKHAEAAGLEALSIRGSPSGATQWSSSYLKRRANRRGRNYRFTSEPLHAPLTLLAAPLSLLQCLSGHTSHMDFILRKAPSGAVS
jgi:SAM-dependent methyltransferase